MYSLHQILPKMAETRDRQEDLTAILDRIIYIGLRGGWDDLKSSSLKVSLDALRSTQVDGLLAGAPGNETLDSSLVSVPSTPSSNRS
jgi:hypothetical protein